MASIKKWVTLGQDESFAWGECQGSGAKPYQVRFDLSDAASKCSCPSRKFPCKHALGLMLILTSTAGAIPKAPMPAWVTEWVASRTERAKPPGGLPCGAGGPAGRAAARGIEARVRERGSIRRSEHWPAVQASACCRGGSGSCLPT